MGGASVEPRVEGGSRFWCYHGLSEQEDTSCLRRSLYVKESDFWKKKRKWHRIRWVHAWAVYVDNRARAWVLLLLKGMLG